MITAHSGCDHTADNSLEFIRYALSLPVDAFELLKAHSDKRINCDFKQKNIEREVFSLAKQYGVEKQLIFTGDVNPELFRKGQSEFPQVAWFTNMETLVSESLWKEFPKLPVSSKIAHMEQVLNQMLAYETAGLNWNYSYVELIWEKAKELGIGISVWTVNDPEQQNVWLSRGVQNITSRNIKHLLSLV